MSGERRGNPEIAAGPVKNAQIPGHPAIIRMTDAAFHGKSPNPVKRYQKEYDNDSILSKG